MQFPHRFGTTRPASGGQRLDMRNMIAAPYVSRLAMAVCACGLPLVAQKWHGEEFFSFTRGEEPGGARGTISRCPADRQEPVDRDRGRAG